MLKVGEWATKPVSICMFRRLYCNQKISQYQTLLGSNVTAMAAATRLLSLLVSWDPSDRELAVCWILRVRETGDTSVRPRLTPRVNLHAGPCSS